MRQSAFMFVCLLLQTWLVFGGNHQKVRGVPLQPSATSFIEVDGAFDASKIKAGDIIVSQFFGLRVMTWQHAVVVTQDPIFEPTMKAHEIKCSGCGGSGCNNDLVYKSYVRPGAIPTEYANKTRVVRYYGPDHERVRQLAADIAVVWGNKGLKYLDNTQFVKFARTLAGCSSSDFDGTHSAKFIGACTNKTGTLTCDPPRESGGKVVNFFCSQYVIAIYQAAIANVNNTVPHPLKKVPKTVQDTINANIRVRASNCIPSSILDFPEFHPGVWKQFDVVNTVWEDHAATKKDLLPTLLKDDEEAAAAAVKAKADAELAAFNRKKRQAMDDILSVGKPKTPASRSLELVG